MKIKKYQNPASKLQPADNTRVAWNPSRETIDAKINTPEKLDMTDNVMGYMPIAGDLLQGAQAVWDFSRGDWKNGMINAGLLLVPNILEKPVKAGIKALKRVPIKKSYRTVLQDGTELWNEAAMDLDIKIGKTEAENFLKSDVRNNAYKKNNAEFRKTHDFDLVRTDDKIGTKATVIPTRKMKDTTFGYYDPNTDKIFINGGKDTGYDEVMFHETLHRNNYGGINLPVKETEEVLETNKFYKNKAENLLKPEEIAKAADTYIADSQEMAANLLELGRSKGIMPGTPYPGDKIADEVFKSLQSGPRRVELAPLDFKNKKKEIWEALAGTYFASLAPLMILINNGSNRKESNEQ